MDFWQLYVDLWDAITEFKNACGGHDRISERRMNAVVQVDNALNALIEARLKGERKANHES